MTTLDDRARAATADLLARTVVDPSARLADLRRAGRRRTAELVVCAAVALGLVAGAWRLTIEDRHPAPVTPPNGEMTNGAIVTTSAQGEWLRFDGTAVHLPDDMVRYGWATFTPDGTELVYPARGGEVRAIDVDTGTTRVLGDCEAGLCFGSLSPDGTVLATHWRDGLHLHPVGSGEDTVLDLPGTGVGYPVWSTDGSRLAYLSEDGLWVVRADGEAPHRVYASSLAGGDGLLREPRPFPLPAWSPDGRRIAVVLADLRGDGPQQDFEVVVVSADGGAVQRVADAGHCACLGLAPPALAWSPDGALLAVNAVDPPGGSSGIYTVEPDGSGWRLRHAGVFGPMLAWRPVSD